MLDWRRGFRGLWREKKKCLKFVRCQLCVFLFLFARRGGKDCEVRVSECLIFFFFSCLNPPNFLERRAGRGRGGSGGGGGGRGEGVCILMR